MKTRIFPYILLLCTAFTLSCSKDNELEPAAKSGGQLEQPLIHGDAPCSVIGSDAEKYNIRKELPAISDPSMFIVHYTIKNGVTYSIEWDKNQKTQRWAAYQVTTNNNTKVWNRNNWRNGYTWKGVYYSGDPFQEDSIIPSPYRTTLKDYSQQNGNVFGQYYQRGHIVNSNDRLISANANGQTFYLSNIQPQIGDFNSGVWLNMENRLNSWGGNISGDETLYIVKGGTTKVTAKVPQPFVQEPGISIKVPRFFWMAILKKKNNGTYQAIAFWAEHKKDKSTALREYVMSIKELEERTGLDFYHNFDDTTEKDFESKYDINAWQGL